MLKAVLVLEYDWSSPTLCKLIGLGIMFFISLHFLHSLRSRRLEVVALARACSLFRLLFPSACHAGYFLHCLQYASWLITVILIILKDILGQPPYMF